MPTKLNVDFASSFGYEENECECSGEQDTRLNVTLNSMYNYTQNKAFIKRRNTDIHNYYKRNYFSHKIGNAKTFQINFY